MKTFQLAIQGGGAKLIDILCALEVIQRYERAGLINITRISGASAGAIAAAIYACGNNSVEKAIDYIKSEKITSEMKRIESKFKKINFIKFAYLWVTGKPIVDPSELRPIYKDILLKCKDEDVSNIESGNLKKDLILTSTNISNNNVHIYEGNFDTLEAILNSSAIPFVFKGLINVKSSPYIDGGLCDNLPIDALKNSEEHNEKIIAISFVDNNLDNTPSSSFEYLLSLFNSSINNNVNKSLGLLPRNSVLKLDSDNGIMDFVKAIECFDKKSTEIKRITEEWVKNLLLESIDFFENTSAYKKISSDIYQWHKNYSEQNDVTIESVHLKLIHRSLNSTEHDVVEKTTVLSPNTDSVVSTFTAIQTSFDPVLYPSNIDIESSSGSEVRFTKIPINIDDKYYLIILFDKELPRLLPNGEKIQYSIKNRTSIPNAFPGLYGNTRNDKYEHSNIRSKKSVRVKMSLVYKTDLKLDFSYRFYDEETEQEVNTLKVSQKNTVNEELLSGCNCDYTAKEWEVESLPYKTCFSVEIKRRL